jgi:glycosyltransferase involved in cell wall biosynthesis
MPEVAGDAALYLDEFSLDEIADRMRTLACDEGVRRRLVEAGFARVKAFRWEETARRTAEVYAAVADAPAADASARRRMFAALTARAPASAARR